MGFGLSGAFSLRPEPGPRGHELDERPFSPPSPLGLVSTIVDELARMNIAPVALMRKQD